MAELAFPNGFIAKLPHENAPDFVRAKVSIKVEEFVPWLRSQDKEWVNLEIKIGRSGKMYAAVDEWQPERQGPQKAKEKDWDTPPPDDNIEDDIPF